MTINVGLVTNEALIFGCDSIASATAPRVNPFAMKQAVDGNGNVILDSNGDTTFTLGNLEIEHVVTNVISGVTKMFKAYEHSNGTVVAGTTAGIAVLNERPIATIVREFFEQQKARSKPFVNVLPVVNAFLKYIRKEYIKDQQAAGYPEQYWGELEFLLGGHGRDDLFPSLYRIKVKSNSAEKQFSNGECGIAWAGQSDSVERLIRGVDSELRNHVEQHVSSLIDTYRQNVGSAMVNILNDTLNALNANMPNGINTNLPNTPTVNLGWGDFGLTINYANLPLQDAIDFVSYLVMTQSGRCKFARGIATVGGRTHIGFSRKGDGYTFLNEPELIHKHTGFSNEPS